MVKNKILDGPTEQRFYILVGDKENWETAAEKKLWGFTERTKGSWNKTKIDEYLAFYVTKPVQRIIGFGRVDGKFVSDDLVWNDEKRFKRSLWRYKLSFEIIHLCKNWNDGIRVGPELYFLQVSRKVINRTTFFNLVKEADKKWGTSIQKRIK